MTTKPNIVIERQFDGFFLSFVDGQRAKYEIWNGSRGVSGRGVNTYGIKNTETGAIKWIGSLAACKKLVKYWLEKEGAR